jgi:undecaprenyl-diphosphatase
MMIWASLACLGLWRKGYGRLAAASFFGTALGLSFIPLLKTWFGRPRPLLSEAYLPDSFAFPSGHAMAVCLTACLFAGIGMRLWPKKRRPVVLSALLLVLCVGLARIYLGLHWVSDVLGGYAFGMAYVLIWWNAVMRRTPPLGGRPTRPDGIV